MEDTNQLLYFIETEKDSTSPSYTSYVCPATVHAEPETRHHIVDHPIRFDQNAPQYRTCCCHVTVRTTIYAIHDLVVAKLTVLGMTISLIQSYDLMTDSPIGKLLIAICYVFPSVQIAFSCMILYGIKKAKNCWLVPDMVLKGLYTAFLSLIALGCVIMWVTSYNLSGMVPQGYGLVVEFISAEICFPIVFAVLLTILYYSYYFHIMKRCFRFLAAKRQAQSARSTAVRKVEMASDINKFQRF